MTILYFIEQSLIQGRSRLIESNYGQRFKVKTYDGNTIDSMFIDGRPSAINGRTLVICSEGNAGFYEIGIMVTAIEAGYSTLGWNHPGFGGSTVSIRRGIFVVNFIMFSGTTISVARA